MAVEDIGKLPYARKHRPNTLVGYIGNAKVKEQAMARLKEPNKPQVMMLIGESGCGKTTFARILTREYRCSNRSITSGACGVCEDCRALDEYIATGSTDDLQYVTEIDIGDDNSKKDVHAYLADVEIGVFGGGWKVYIFDEFHMAPPSTQNSLLKLFEEPPENVLFMVCTTNPESVIPTIRNRAQLTLTVTKPSISELSCLLRDVCVKESKEYDMKGLALVASKGDLVIRDALNSLEQVIVQKGDAKYESVLSVFDTISDSEMFNFFRKLLNKDIVGYVNMLHEIKTKMNLNVFVSNLINFTKRGIYILNNKDVDGLTENELKMYKELFMQFSVTQIKMLITKLLDMQNSDVEIKLLLMAYTGLSEEVSSGDIDETDILFIEHEEALEHNSNDENFIKRLEPDKEVVDKRLDDLTGEASIDFLINKFGGSIIK